ncbi:EAL domain-containing protein [Lacrimispora xylanisolvens]|uniref:EAL domain-containing protein n=1 Tax=Lacrimispora xylanisolvens TaxID=384636 RepID=UPI002402781C
MDNKQQLLNRILEGRYLTPVFQPIVSLVDGKTYGYEALSRISQKELEMNIEEMFQTAFKHNKSWELETLCRVKALEHSIHMERGKKLFLNVNCNIIYDNAFREGFTKAYLQKFGLSSNDIIF